MRLRERTREFAIDSTLVAKRRGLMQVHAIDLTTTFDTIRAWQVNPWPAVAAGIGALLLGFISTFNVVLFVVYGSLVMLDTIAGSLAAFKSRDPMTGRTRFNGAILVGGLLGKLIRLCVVAVAILMDLGVAAGLPDGSPMATLTPLTKLVLGGMIWGEGMSILETAERSEGKLPGVAHLREALDKWRAKDKGNGH